MLTIEPKSIFMFSLFRYPVPSTVTIVPTLPESGVAIIDGLIKNVFVWAVYAMPPCLATTVFVP